MKRPPDTQLPAIIAAARRKMRERGHTQSDVAQWIGVTQGEISRILSGRRRRLTQPIRNLCQYASYDLIIGSDNDDHPEPLSQVLSEIIGDNPEAEKVLIDILRALSPLLHRYITPVRGTKGDP